MAVQAQLHPDNLGLPMCGLQDWVVNNPLPSTDAADLCFSFQNHPQYQQHLLPRQNMTAFDCNRGACSSASTSGSCFVSMSLSQCLHAQLELQRQEIDCILQIQVKVFRIPNGVSLSRVYVPISCFRIIISSHLYFLVFLKTE